MLSCLNEKKDEKQIERESVKNVANGGHSMAGHQTRRQHKREGTMSDKFFISTDKSKLDILTIHKYLSERSYWARGRPLETVKKSIDNSLCVGIYDRNDTLLGFGRVITDYAVFAWIIDVFILEEHRGQGLGKRLIEYIMDFPELKHLKRWQLVTDNAHGLYEKYGFVRLAAPEKHMEKVHKANC
jgi:GNAT superfamily N-acetyltransferase